MDTKRFASPFSGDLLRWTDRLYRADIWPAWSMLCTTLCNSIANGETLASHDLTCFEVR